MQPIENITEILARLPDQHLQLVLKTLQTALTQVNQAAASLADPERPPDHDARFTEHLDQAMQTLQQTAAVLRSER